MQTALAATAMDGTDGMDDSETAPSLPGEPPTQSIILPIARSKQSYPLLPQTRASASVVQMIG